MLTPSLRRASACPGSYMVALGKGTCTAGHSLAPERALAHNLWHACVALSQTPSAQVEDRGCCVPHGRLVGLLPGRHGVSTVSCRMDALANLLADSSLLVLVALWSVRPHDSCVSGCRYVGRTFSNRWHQDVVMTATNLLAVFFVLAPILLQCLGCWLAAPAWAPRGRDPVSALLRWLLF